MQRRTFLSHTLAGASALALPHSALGFAGDRPSRPLNILVLGGTNFVGPAVVEQALAHNHNVTLFNRGITRPELFPELEKLQGFRGELQQNLSALEGGRRWDAVVDVWPQRSSLVDATAALLADRVDYYFFVSSIAVYRDFSKPGLDERSPVRQGEDGYGGEKVAAESIVADLYQERFGVGRCHSIFGPRDPGATLHYWLRRVANYNEVVAPGDGSDPVQFVDVRDVAAWIVKSIEHRITGVHNLAGPTLHFQKFINICKNVVGSSANLINVDGDFIYGQGINGFDEMPLWFPEQEDPGFFRISVEKAKNAGMKFRPHEDTIAAAWRWYQSAFFKDTVFPYNGWGISRQHEEELIKAWRQRGRGE